MDEDRYIKDRLDEQITWHETRSSSSQSKYKVLTVINIIAAALVPLLTALPAVFAQVSHPHVNFVVGGLGVLVTILSGVLALHKYQETWVQYRSTAESLRKEKFTFLTRSNPYHREEPFALLVERVENLLASNTAHWAQFTKAKGAGSKAKTAAAKVAPAKTASGSGTSVGAGVDPIGNASGASGAQSAAGAK